MSGLSRTPGKRVRVNSPPRVRIPLSPPIPCYTGYFFISMIYEGQKAWGMSPQVLNFQSSGLPKDHHQIKNLLHLPWAAKTRAKA